MTRPTELYPRAWIAHHQLQWGRNWPYVKARFIPKRKEVSMNS